MSQSPNPNHRDMTTIIPDEFRDRLDDYLKLRCSVFFSSPVFSITNCCCLKLKLFQFDSILGALPLRSSRTPFGNEAAKFAGLFRRRVWFTDFKVQHCRYECPGDVCGNSCNWIDSRQGPTNFHRHGGSHSVHGHLPEFGGFVVYRRSLSPFQRHRQPIALSQLAHPLLWVYSALFVPRGKQ